jgi:hypothetical protein
MRISYSDPNVPRPAPPGAGAARPARRKRVDWWKRRLRLAITALDALNRQQDPEHPFRHQWHSRDTARVLLLRWRYKRGAFAGPLDRADVADAALPPAIPALEPASVLGYCLGCGDELTTRADLCGRCAGIDRAA